MSKKQYDLQRNLITVEELLQQCRSDFIDFAEQNAPPVAEFDRAIKQVSLLQEEMRKWFAP